MRVSRGVLGAKRLVGPRPSHEVSHTKGARESMRQVNANFQALVKSIEASTPDILQFAVQPILDQADIYVPKDTESLRESQYAETFRMGKIFGIEIGYGHVSAVGSGRHDPRTYAAMVHERPDLQHEAPTQYKYLQTAIQERLSQVLPRVHQFLSGAFK